MLLAVLCSAAPIDVARAQKPCPASLTVWPVRATNLAMMWKGTIDGPMAECITTEIAKTGPVVTHIWLYLDSGGGSLGVAENVIAELKRIRGTHRLFTIVSQGATCGSACVPVFLAGERRYGALSSIWLFHEVGAYEKNRMLTTDRDKTERVFQDYFLAAGVSEAWLYRLRPLIQHSNYWQTGHNLVDDKSGIITHPLENLVARGTERREF